MHSYSADFYGQEMKVVALGYIRYKGTAVCVCVCVLGGGGSCPRVEG
jgi:hypothetical protein